MVESGRVPRKSIICSSNDKLARRVSKNGRISEYPKMVESGRVLGKGIIRASNEKLSRRVSKNGSISVSTGK